MRLCLRAGWAEVREGRVGMSGWCSEGLSLPSPGSMRGLLAHVHRSRVLGCHCCPHGRMGPRARPGSRPPAGHFLWVSDCLIGGLHEQLFLAGLEIVWILAQGKPGVCSWDAAVAHWEGMRKSLDTVPQGRPGPGTGSHQWEGGSLRRSLVGSLREVR